MQLFPENSVLESLPNSLGKKQTLILDSIRFTARMIEHSYVKLIEEIESVSNPKSENKKDLPKLFQNAWGIIDNSSRLLKIICLLDSKTDHKIAKELIKKLRVFRNTFQHLDERIEELILNENEPIYGRLKWCYSFANGQFINVIAIPGHFYSNNNKVTVGCWSSNKVENIELDSVSRQEKIKLNISELLNYLESFCSNIEKELKEIFTINNMPLVNRKSINDVVFILKQ
jgi:hypothetical protein